MAAAADPGLMADRTYVGAHFRASDGDHDLSKEFKKELGLSPGVRDLFLGLPASLNANGVPVTAAGLPIFTVKNSKLVINNEIETVRSMLISSQNPVKYDFKNFDIGDLRDGQMLTTHGIDESGKYIPYTYTVATLDVRDNAEGRPPSIPANVFARLFGIEATGQTVNIMIDASPIAINELISKLTPVDGFRLNVNLVVNREAVNDPATRPSELNAPAGDHVRCDTLYDSGQSNIIYSEKNPFFTKYTITMGKLDIGKDPKRLKALKCKVEISYGEKETHISLNPKKDNSIDTCLKFIKGLFSAVYDLFTRKRISVAYTQKASGDAGEAMSALDDTREYTSLNTRKRYTLKTIGGQVFIVTHDRILFAFCLYIGVNVLFCHNIGGVKTLYSIRRAIEISAEEKLAQLVGQYDEAKGSVDRWRNYMEIYNRAVDDILGGLMGEAEAKYVIVTSIRPKSITNAKYAAAIIEWLKALWKIKGLRYLKLDNDFEELIKLIGEVEKDKEMTTEKATMMSRVIGIHTMFLTVSTKFPRGPANPEPKTYNTDKNYVLMINPLMLIKEGYRESDTDSPKFRCIEIFKALQEGINTYERYGKSFENIVFQKISEIYGALEDSSEIRNKTLLYSVINIFGVEQPEETEENAPMRLGALHSAAQSIFAAEVAGGGGGGGGGPEENEFVRAARALIRYRDAELPDVDRQLEESIQENKEIVEGESAKIEAELKAGPVENVAKALLGISENIKRENLISELEVPYTFTRCDGLISSVLYSEANRVWDSLLAAAGETLAKKARSGSGGSGYEEYDFLSKMYIHELYKAFQEIDTEQSFDTGYYVELSAAVLACLELYENPIDHVHCFYYLLPNVETGAGFLARYIALTTVDLATYDGKMPELPKMDEIDMEEIIENARSFIDMSPEQLLKKLYKVVNPKASPAIKSSSKVPKSIKMFSPQKKKRPASPLVPSRLEFRGAQGGSMPKKTRRKRKGRRLCSTKRHAPK